MMSFLLRAAIPASFVLAAGPAFAHGGQADAFATGLSHPLMGLDHLVAMVAVGLWAARAGLRPGWALPAVFLTGMTAGILAGLLTPLPGGIEHAIAGTVVILGLLVALTVPMHAVAALALAGVFGLLHGLPHGAEIDGGILGSVAGMLVASAALQGAGFALGRLPIGGVRLAHAVGAGIASTGVMLLLAA